MNLDAARLVVTGGAGLIGSTTIDLLLRETKVGHVVALDNLVRGSLANLERALRDPRVEFQHGDVCDRAAVQHAMRGADALLHLAALRITACAAEPRRALEVMCDGSFNVLEAALEAGVRRIVAASSASVYGLAESFPTAETQAPWRDRTWYGASKLLLEGLLRSVVADAGVPSVALRYFNVYGPRMDLHGQYTEVLIRWMDRIARGEPPLVLGNGRQTMDFVDVEDVARANLLALSSNVPCAGEAFNVASGAETSLNDLADALLKAMGSTLRPVYGPERKVNPVSRRLADTRKAEEMLGFKARIGLDQGLARLVAWHAEAHCLDRLTAGAALSS